MTNATFRNTVDVVAEYRDEQRAFFHAVRGALSATSQNGRNTFYSVLAARKKIVRQDKKKKKIAHLYNITACLHYNVGI